jgi:hypothetical protein
MADRGMQCIYFALSGKEVKIGITRDPAPPQLQVECWRLVSRLTQKPTHCIVRVVTGAIEEGCGNGLPSA